VLPIPKKSGVKMSADLRDLVVRALLVSIVDDCENMGRHKPDVQDFIDPLAKIFSIQKADG
jgi:hypothetical protein